MKHPRRPRKPRITVPDSPNGLAFVQTLERIGNRQDRDAARAAQAPTA